MALHSDFDELDLRAYLHVIRRRKRLIAAIVVLTVAAGLTFSLLQRPVYRATSEVLLQSRTSQTIIAPGQPQQNAQYLQQQVQTEIQVMRSRSVTSVVERTLGYLPDVSVAAKGDTQVVAISARDADRSRSMREADTYARTYVNVRRAATISDLLDAATKIRGQTTAIDATVAALDATLGSLDGQIVATADAGERGRLEGRRQRVQADQAPARRALLDRRGAYAQQLDQLQLAANLSQSGGAEIVSQAMRPTAPISPQPRRDGLIALGLGLVLALGLAFVVDYLDDSLRAKDDLDEATGGLPVLGLIPTIDGWRDPDVPRLVSIADPQSAPAEAYRGMRASLHFLGLDRAIKVVQLTSPSAAEGKTTTLANLGVALARAGQRVIVVDCDLRRPRLHKFFDMDGAIGFTSVILGDVGHLDALQVVDGVPRLSLLAAGPTPPNPSELLSIRATRDLLATLAGHADYVLVDTPPLLPVADAVVVAGYADATILVATAGTTTRRAATRALELLRQVGAPLAGVVFNNVRVDTGDAYSYDDAGRDRVAKRARRPGRRRRRGGEAPSQGRPGPGQPTPTNAAASGGADRAEVVR